MSPARGEKFRRRLRQLFGSCAEFCREYDLRQDSVSKFVRGEKFYWSVADALVDAGVGVQEWPIRPKKTRTYFDARCNP